MGLEGSKHREPKCDREFRQLCEGVPVLVAAHLILRS
jgi:hypothetical protein